MERPNKIDQNKSTPKWKCNLPKSFDVHGCDTKVWLEYDWIRRDLVDVADFALQRLACQDIRGRMLVQPAVGLLHQLTETKETIHINYLDHLSIIWGIVYILMTAPRYLPWLSEPQSWNKEI